MSITIAIIIVTVLTSIAAFQNQQLFEKLAFHPVSIVQNKEWTRALTVGFVHNDYSHLFFNMFTFYFFGSTIENYFTYLFPYGNTLYLAFYLIALLISGIPDLIKNKDNPYYSAVGASGAVSAIVFAYILFDPRATLYLQLFIPIPAALYAVGYLFYSYYMAKKGVDNIGHLTHFAGAVFGFVFPILLKPELVSIFLQKLTA
jgi:membrane associated rhomboid family serine protease